MRILSSSKSYKNFNADQLHDAKLLARVYRNEFPFMMFGKDAINENVHYRKFLATISGLSSSKGKRFINKVIGPRLLWRTHDMNLMSFMLFDIHQPMADYFLKHGIEVKKWSKLNRDYGTWPANSDEFYMEDDEIMEKCIRHAKRFWRLEDTKRAKRIEREFRKLKTKDANEVGIEVVNLLRQYYKNVVRLQKQITKFADSI